MNFSSVELPLVFASLVASFASEFAFACFGFGPAILYEISWQICAIFGISGGALEAAIWNIIIIELPTGLLQLFKLRKHFEFRLFIFNLPFALMLILGTLALERFGRSRWVKRFLGVLFLGIALLQLVLKAKSRRANVRPSIQVGSLGRTVAVALLCAVSASGLLRGFFGVAGPPMMVFCFVFPIERDAWRCWATNNRLTTAAVQGLLLGLHADFDVSRWPMYLALVIGGLSGIICGNQVAQHVDAATFQRWLILFLASGALLMLSSGNRTLSIAASLCVATVISTAAAHTLVSIYCKPRSYASSAPGQTLQPHQGDLTPVPARMEQE